MKDAFYEKLQKVPEFKTPEEEIGFLRGELERHIDSNTEIVSAEQKREDAAESIVESYKKVPLHEVIDESRHISPQEVEGITLQLAPEVHDDVMAELHTIMMEKGIKNVIEVVMRINNPHIEDDFHRFLVQYLASSFEVPGLKPKTDLAKSLGLRIYEIILPNKKSGEERDYKQTVALMEQFMAGMQSIANDPRNKDKSFYTLELALAEGTSDMAMYVTVPKARGNLFEKQLLGLFEEVRMTEVFDDYNIFSYSGVTSAAYGVASTHEVLQTKVYTDFDHDPMNVLVNAFSKLESTGEGASIQFVIMPNGEYHIREYGDVLDELKKGEKLNDAIGSSVMDNIGKGFKEIFNPKSKEQEEKHKSEKVIDDDAVASVTEKLNSTIVQTNIRIVTSAPTKQRSDEILHDLESAFQQFNNTKGNGIKFKRAIGRALEDTIHEYIFRMFNTPHTFRLNLKELATMYHFPLEISQVSQLKQEGSKIAPAPSNTPNEGIIIGKNVFRHKETLARMTPKDRLRHFYTIGQTGTGKSHLFTQMIIQDIQNGDGVCYIDPHGTDIEEILKYIPPERIDDVVYFDPAHTERPMALNMLEYDVRFPEQKSFVINEMMSIFGKLFDMQKGGGAMFEQYFRNSAGLVMEHPESGNTLLEIGRVLGDKSFRDMKLRYCTNPIIKQFWINAEKTTGEQGLENFIPYITSKFDVFISNEIMRPVVAQQKSSFNFREIMDNKKILLVNLSKGRLGEINANLIGLVLVGKILMAALSRVDSLDKEMPPFYLYIDEFQNVSTDSISQILSEARKYGLGLHMAHQFIAQLDEGIKNAVFGNVGTMATFRISFEDAQYIERRFLPQFTADDIMKIPNRNAYLQMIGNGVPLVPFNIETFPLDYFAKKNPDGVAQKIKQLSYLKFGKDRKEVEADITRRYM
ncbi:MAG: hypothetical protein ACI870_000284 [Crocinitomicaceae bacterium]|jgi:hypothetical protein